MITEIIPETILAPTIAFGMIGTIFFILFLSEWIKKPKQQPTSTESDQPESEQTDQQSETATTPRKIPVKTIIGIVIVIAIGGIFFSIPGDTSDKIEKAKSVIPREAPKIPPTTAVICIDDFEEEARGKDRIKKGDYTTLIKDEKLTMKAKRDDKASVIYLLLDEKYQKREAIAIQYIVEISENRENGFGGYIYDNSFRSFTFDGKKISFFLQNEKNVGSPYSNKVKGQYKITLTRIVNDDSVVELRTSVAPVSGKKYERTTTYRLFQEKNLTELGLNFYSKDRESKLEISEIIVYASEN